MVDHLEGLDEQENEERMKRGELYYAFTPKLAARRKKCRIATRKFNKTDEVPRRELVKLLRDIISDSSPLPPPATTEEKDDALLEDEPYVDAPIKFDYGNVRFGKGCYINSNSTFIDTCLITIGARTLVGPNCSFFSGTHPTDAFVRNGTKGPEMGSPIEIGEDCWLGGNVVVLPGVTIGRGATVGAGSVVAKDVPEFCVVVGNPARVVKKVEPKGPDPRPVKTA